MFKLITYFTALIQCKFSIVTLIFLSLAANATTELDEVNPLITEFIDTKVINPQLEELNSTPQSLSFGGVITDPSTPLPPSTIANEDVMERLNVSDSVTPETSELLGERVDLNTGSLSFQQTDVSLPGNNGLSVALTRTYKGGNYSYLKTLNMGDWMLDIPNIHTTLLRSDIRYSGSWGQGKECSGSLNPGDIADLGSLFQSFEYWNGDTLNIPGQVNEKLLENNGTLTSATDYSRVTKSNWRISCGLRADKTGEKFIVQSPQGTTYVFSELVLVSAEGMERDFKVTPRYQAFMFITEIKDRFGNTVNYNYTNKKLTTITSSDGRLISINYGTGVVDSNYIRSVVVNGNRWQYDYDEVAGNRLTKVTRPDNLFWSYSLVGADAKTGSTTAYDSGLDICKIPDGNEATASITHPNGITGVYTLNPTLHGRSNVVRNMSDNTDYTPKCFGSMSLTSKVLSGPGISTQTWSYTYSQNSGVWASETAGVGAKLTGILPTQINDVDYKRTTVESPDDSKTIYYHNRDFGSVSDGKLSVTEVYDIGGSTLLQRTINNYSAGNSFGSVELLNENLLPHTMQSLLTRTDVELYSTPSIKDTYTTLYSNFNSYGVAEKIEESNTASSAVRFTQKSFQQDTASWLLNLPRTTAISKQDSGFQKVSETTYQTITQTNQNESYTTLVPEYEKSFNVWQKHYVSYHNDGNINRIEFNQGLTVGGGNRYQAFTNYKRGQPKTITVPKRYATGAMSITRTLDDNGRVTQTSDLENNVVNYTYDKLGRIQSIDPVDTVDTVVADTAFIWTMNGGDSNNQPKRVVKRCIGLNANKTDCSGTAKLSTITTYDSLLRPILVETTDGTTSVFQNSDYNPYNKATFQSYPSTSALESDGTTIDYDGLQRQTKQSVTGGGDVNTSYLDNNQIQTSDANSYITTTTYLAYGSPSYEQATFIDSPEAVDTTLTLNIFGNITSITQSGTHKSGSISQTEYRAYDSQQRLCQIKRNDVGTTVISLKASGEVDWQAQGQTAASNTVCLTSAGPEQKVNFTYDNLGQQQTINYGDPTPTVTYTLDGNGDLIELSAGDITQAYNYTSTRQLDWETLDVDGKFFILDYEYDELGALSAITYPNEHADSNIGKVSFAPNDFGQATMAASVEESYATGATYYPSGMIDTFTYGNNLIHKTTLNTRKLPSSINDYGFDVEIKDNKVSLNYTYDNQNNIKSIIDDVNPSYNLTNLNYDGLDRLISTVGNSDIGDSAITYDALGNITKYSSLNGIKNHDLTYNYNLTSNMLTGLTGSGSAGYDFNQSNSYDTRGNVTDNGMRAFTYNLANQMTESEGNIYTYDGYNRRVITKDTKGTSYSMYSQSGRLMYRETSTGGINYIFLGDKLIAKEGVMVASTDSEMHYKPFGETVEQAKDEVGYTGHKFDTDLGLSYMQARYYDPVIGRFYSNDPVGYIAENPVMSFNRYLYVNNNPYKYTDPNGELLFLALLGLGAVETTAVTVTAAVVADVMLTTAIVSSISEVQTLGEKANTQIDKGFAIEDSVNAYMDGTGSGSDISQSIADAGNAQTDTAKQVLTTAKEASGIIGTTASGPSPMATVEKAVNAVGKALEVTSAAMEDKNE